MQKNKVTIKDKNLRKLVKRGGRNGAQQDFYELLKRALASPKAP